MRRVRIRQQVGARFIAGASRGEGTLYDVSAEGFYMHSPILLERGCHVSVVFRTPAGSVSVAQGEVRWNSARVTSQMVPSGFGVHVTCADDDFRGLVQAALTTDGYSTCGRTPATEQ